ncbi:hypothetical protein BJ742DRAFT_824711 [Cladochytrium replicatum]|nr:hypothetical protein BJ742DRAFT_824711 [Cladochytrium replicatum]
MFSSSFCRSCFRARDLRAASVFFLLLIAAESISYSSSSSNFGTSTSSSSPCIVSSDTATLAAATPSRPCTFPCDLRSSSIATFTITPARPFEPPLTAAPTVRLVDLTPAPLPTSSEPTTVEDAELTLFSPEGDAPFNAVCAVVTVALHSLSTELSTIATAASTGLPLPMDIVCICKRSVVTFSALANTGVATTDSGQNAGEVCCESVDGVVRIVASAGDVEDETSPPN